MQAPTEPMTVAAAIEDSDLARLFGWDQIHEHWNGHSCELTVGCDTGSTARSLLVLRDNDD